MHKVLFDTDIGSDIDDALALEYLLCEPGCELLGVTTVTGQPELRAEMVSAVCRNLGRDEIPIHVGCEKALLGENRQQVASQAAALKDWPRRTFSKENTAIEFLRRTIRANPGEISLLAVGPMTNIAVLFATDPEIPSLLKELVLNRDDARKRFADMKSLAPVSDFAEVWFQRCEHVTFHDPLAAVGLFHRDVCEYNDQYVRVSLAEPTMGWTVPDWRQDAPKVHRLAKSVDADRFFDLYCKTLR